MSSPVDHSSPSQTAAATPAAQTATPPPQIPPALHAIAAANQPNLPETEGNIAAQGQQAWENTGRDSRDFLEHEFPTH